MLSFFRRILPRAVANSGSELRDHLANERTFLSWTRMGLAFAAMALALGRLSLIDHMVNSRWGGNINGNGNGNSNGLLPSSSSTSTSTSPISSPTDKNKTGTPSTASSEKRSLPGADLVASRVCQGISIWCFGYGLFRYVSVRNHLTRGLFVPGIWGPVFMTCGSLGVFATVMHFDWRRDVREPVAALSSGVGEKKRE